MFFRHLGH